MENENRGRKEVPLSVNITCHSSQEVKNCCYGVSENRKSGKTGKQLEKQEAKITNKAMQLHENQRRVFERMMINSVS